MNLIDSWLFWRRYSRKPDLSVQNQLNYVRIEQFFNVHTVFISFSLSETAYISFGIFHLCSADTGLSQETTLKLIYVAQGSLFISMLCCRVIQQTGFG